MRFEDVLVPRREGLYCPPADAFIDPVRPVPRAVITHAHADHARPGHGAVLATRHTLEIMRIRMGDGVPAATQAAAYGEPIEIGEARVTLFPAGHVLGSAQILVEHRGVRAVVTGDYKTRADPTSEAFVPVPCDLLVTEATFGLPVFRHPEPADEIAKLLASLRQFPERTHLVGVYAFGKAQRMARALRDEGYDAPIFLHGALRKLCDYYEGEGVALGELPDATLQRGRRRDFSGVVVLGPPSAFAATWVRRFADPLVAFASGWMRVRSRARQRGAELPLIISDHCDWDELTAVIRHLGPEEVWVTHGREEALVRWCTLEGIPARPLHLVGYEDEPD
jgi:putative mRNA 3-end processing factor